jgi:GMP synthase (glutamine-hydrolysing)
VLALGSAARTLCEVEGGAQRDEAIEKRAVTVTYSESPLFAGLEAGERWLEHSHDLILPQEYVPVAEAEGTVVGFAHAERPLYGLQFQVEKNDPDGIAILLNFALNISKCTVWWEESAFVERAKGEVCREIGQGQAICSVTGGLNSTVCALLTERAVPDRLHCVLVDTGLLREGEPEWVAGQLAELGLRVRQVDARARVVEALAGVVDATRKSAVMRRVIAEVMEAEAERIGGVTAQVRGTNYSDIVQAASQAEAAACQAEAAACEEARSRLDVLTPLSELFRDEVYRVGELLELPATLLQRQPFPDAGLAVRVLGEATPERLHALRAAQAILEAEVEEAGLARKLWKYYATLAQIPAGESAGQVVLLRAVQQSEMTAKPARLPYDLLERVAGRIQIEVPGITRVMYDVTSAVHTRDEL